MQGECEMRFRSSVILLSIILITVSASPVNAQSQASLLKNLSHIHHLESYGSRILLGTHEGLFEYLGKGRVRGIGSSGDDFMGLTSDEKNIYRSGHPGVKSNLPNPIGLMQSTDDGKTWKSVSLKGQVDFHFLETANGELYGVDSGSGNLFHSQDSGENWKVIGENKFSDIAISPSQKNSAFAIAGGVLIRTSNSFKGTTLVKKVSEPRFVEWSSRSLFLASKNTVSRSENSGKTWKRLNSFPGEISAFSASNKVIVAVVDNQIFISRNEGKSFSIF